MSEGCLIETECLRIQHIDNGRKRRFADFAFPKQSEVEVLFSSQMETEFPFPCVSVKPISHFPVSMSGPNST